MLDDRTQARVDDAGGWTLVGPADDDSHMLPWQAVDPIETTVLHRKVGVLSMVCIAFFWVSGGIYGNEELMGAGPGLYVLMLLVLTPLFFSLPIALITAELATVYPIDGGQCVYVQRACGDAVGGHNCYYVFVINVVDAAIYPLLACQYLGYHVHITYLQSRALCIAMIGVVTTINLFGLEVLTRFQGIIFIVTLMPCVVFIVSALPSLDPAAFTRTDGAPVDLALLISWTLWLYSGFSSLGTIAGEAKSPTKTYLQTIAILFPLVIALNMLPFMAALSVDGDISHYSAGYFTKLAEHVLPQPFGGALRLAFVIGSNVALIGLYNSQAITAQCTAFFFVESRAELQQMRLRALEMAKRMPTTSAAITRWLLDVPSSGVPRVYVLLTAGACSALVWLPYGMLVEFEVLLYCLSKLLFFYSFILLRAAHSDVPRKFQVMPGVRGAVALAVIPALICVVNLYVGLYVSPGTGGGQRRLEGEGDEGDERELLGVNSADAWVPGPNFKQQAFISVLLLGGFMHATYSILISIPTAELEVLPPELPLEQPLLPTRRAGEADHMTLVAAAPGTEHEAVLVPQTAHAPPGSLTSYNAEEIVDSVLPRLAEEVDMILDTDPHGVVLNRNDIVRRYYGTVCRQRLVTTPRTRTEADLPAADEEEPATPGGRTSRRSLLERLSFLGGSGANIWRGTGDEDEDGHPRAAAPPAAPPAATEGAPGQLL